MRSTRRARRVVPGWARAWRAAPRTARPIVTLELFGSKYRIHFRCN
jgi:hypothetical protein